MFVTRDISETPGTVSPQTGGRLGWSTDFRAPGPTVLRGLGGRGTLSPGALGPAGVGGWQEPEAVRLTQRVALGCLELGARYCSVATGSWGHPARFSSSLEGGPTHFPLLVERLAFREMISVGPELPLRV